MANYEGGCSCGSVRYTLSADPMFTHICHCSLCKKITGSAFIINAMIEGYHFRLNSGILKDFIGPSGSGGSHKIKRCDTCGEPIVSYFGGTEFLAVVKVGSLDDPRMITPQAEIFVENRLDWLKTDMSIPEYQKSYNFEETWPSESYERLKQVRKMQRHKNSV